MSCGKKIPLASGSEYYICGKKEVYSKYSNRIVGELNPFRKCFKCDIKDKQGGAK